MNDATNVDLKQKQDKVDQGRRIMERIEDGFDKMHDLLAEGHAAGMMDICECHELQNLALELKYKTFGLHCRLTAMAKRNKCDVPGGGPVVQGGPGR